MQQYNYVWIIPGTYEEDWLSENIIQTKFDFECLHSISEIDGFVHEQRIIAVNHYPSPNTSNMVSSVLMLVETSLMRIKGVDTIIKGEEGGGGA